MKIKDMSYDVVELPIVRRHHIAKVDEDGNRLFDRCGRPLYKQVERRDVQKKWDDVFLIEHDGVEKWYTERQAKYAFGQRQLRIARKEYRKIVRERRLREELAAKNNGDAQ